MRLALIDGEHYPAVTKWALKRINACCAVFLGGSEKIERELELDITVFRDDDYLKAIKRAIEAFPIEEVIDLSDEPILTYEDRFRIASFLMLHGITYRGADFEFRPKRMKRLKKPSISIIGTGKRIGKTGVSGFVARTLKEVANPVIVTMGRGGPEEPEIIDGENIKLTPERLLEVVEKGRHAASDHFEDALTSRVLTIGCRRCGGGMAGFSFFDIVEKGVRIAEACENSPIIVEGSGATFPAIKADAYITLVGAHQKLEFIKGYFGPFRIGLADIAVITMAEEPMASDEKIEALKIGISTNLANRPKLREDLKRFNNYETVLVELKAAAVDVVTREALSQGKKIIYMDNEPKNVDGKDLKKAVLKLWEQIRDGKA